MGELGTTLARAREARGLTLEDAERDTRISRRYLQALEAEQFDVIPAPVYARGFLRSYSQYLGLDPKETLELFPRDDEPGYPAQQSRQRASMQQPIAATSPSRPAWRRPQQQRQEPQPQRPPARPPQRGQQQQAPERAAQPRARRQQDDYEEPFEPTIGVDIGIPAPARRIKTDPAAQTRSAVIAIVAVGAVIAVILMSFLISNLGSDSSAAPPIGGTKSNGSGNVPTTAASQQANVPPAAETTPRSGLDVTPGVVPSLIGVSAEKAKLAIAEAGYKVAEKKQKDKEAKGIVIDQSPASGVQFPEGSTVNIVTSDGP